MPTSLQVSTRWWVTKVQYRSDLNWVKQLSGSSTPTFTLVRATWRRAIKTSMKPLLISAGPKSQRLLRGTKSWQSRLSRNRQEFRMTFWFSWATWTTESTGTPSQCCNWWTKICTKFCATTTNSLLKWRLARFRKCLLKAPLSLRQPTKGVSNPTRNTRCRGHLPGPIAFCSLSTTRPANWIRKCTTQTTVWRFQTTGRCFRSSNWPSIYMVMALEREGTLIFPTTLMRCC